MLKSVLMCAISRSIQCCVEMFLTEVKLLSSHCEIVLQKHQIDIVVAMYLTVAVFGPTGAGWLTAQLSMSVW